MKLFTFALISFSIGCLFQVNGQTTSVQISPKWDEITEKDIKSLLDAQTVAINKNSLADLMKGFWKSDSLTFVVKDGIADGWDKLNSYQKHNMELMAKKDPPVKRKMSYEIKFVEQWSPNQVFLIGKGIVTKEDGEVGMTYHFSLILEKKSSKWVITSETIS